MSPEAAQAFILDDIPLWVDPESFLRQLRLPPHHETRQEIAELARQAQSLARPKALYRHSPVEEVGEDFVRLEGVSLRSRLLSHNLRTAKCVFPYLATCGTELEAWSQGGHSLLTRYAMEALKSLALEAALRAFREHLDSMFHPGQLSVMNPGSLADWPLQEQLSLFRLLGDHAGALGVRLTESLLMVPVKSVSGLAFGSRSGYLNCRLCRRERCPSRKAAYDAEFRKRVDALPEKQ